MSDKRFSEEELDSIIGVLDCGHKSPCGFCDAAAALRQVRADLALARTIGDSSACDDEGRIFLYQGRPVVNLDDPNLPPIAHYMALYVNEKAENEKLHRNQLTPLDKAVLEAAFVWNQSYLRGAFGDEERKLSTAINAREEKLK